MLDILRMGSGKIVLSRRSLSTLFLTVFEESPSSFAMRTVDFRAALESARTIATSVSVKFFVKLGGMGIRDNEIFSAFVILEISSIVLARESSPLYMTKS